MAKRTRSQQREDDNANRMFDDFEKKTRGVYRNIPEKEGHTEVIQEARGRYAELMRHVEEGRPKAIAYLTKIRGALHK